MSKLKCPECGSEEIGQFRMMTGPVWCCECDYKIEQKEIFNPFIVKDDDVVENSVAGPTIIEVS